MEKYNILQEIGRGAFGIVSKAQNLETQEIVAIKKMVQEYETWEECINLRELKSLKKLNHINIIKLKEVFRVKKELSFVFEYADRNLFKLYDNAKTEGITQLPENTIKTIVYQITSALAYMHKHGFFHRDLKPENLLITSDNIIKLIDFGLAREIRSRPPYTDYVSTRWYRAPEILLRSTNYNSPVDIFALGCIMAELYLMKPLFSGTSEIDQLQKITSVLGTPQKSDWADGYILASQKHFNFPQYQQMQWSQVIPGASPDAINLIQECIKWDPHKRITTAKILQHPYFNNVELPEEIKQYNNLNNNNNNYNNNCSTNIQNNMQKRYPSPMAYDGANNNLQFDHQFHKSLPQKSPNITSMSPDRIFQNYKYENEIMNYKNTSDKQQQGYNFNSKNYDPIYEFLNNDVRNLKNQNVKQTQQRDSSEQINYFNKKQQNQIKNVFEAEEEYTNNQNMDEILGKYIPTKNVKRVRNNNNQMVNNSNYNKNIFLEDDVNNQQNSIDEKQNQGFSTRFKNKAAESGKNSLQEELNIKQSYVPSALTKKQNNDGNESKLKHNQGFSLPTLNFNNIGIKNDQFNVDSIDKIQQVKF
ncbi:protein kinase domain protein [Ichthyophthirius multifiliis]|uniref:Protein kinase domain protein n=1 Tax=Ichthyophthirius multifiliis TaxID=5932 RepID=G0QWI8_ICHMU|nr:protein kinase domain protein [Ichthyophthirius multifiliis]EGR30417.1 protein kinase domain protein [Ichthyophthirius multifiliis]|eukprot:XP_004032004.1 protein kinase domain protein [Ichthyophthirius multifiliis]